MSEKPRPVVGDNRTQVQRFIEILAHCRRGGVLDVANIDEMLAYFAARQGEEAREKALRLRLAAIGVAATAIGSAPAEVAEVTPAASAYPTGEYPAMLPGPVQWPK